MRILYSSFDLSMMCQHWKFHNTPTQVAYKILLVGGLGLQNKNNNNDISV